MLYVGLSEILQRSIYAATQNDEWSEMSSLIQRLTAPLRKARALLMRERDNLRLGLARRDAYRQSYCRLASQSNAELAAHGLSRRDIADRARQAAFHVI